MVRRGTAAARGAAVESIVEFVGVGQTRLPADHLARGDA